MPIRWKVTTRDRESAIVSHLSIGLIYKAKTIVRAYKGTFGIAVFETKKLAEQWSGPSVIRRKILRVRGIGRGIRPTQDFPQANYEHDAEETLEEIYRLGVRKFLKKYRTGWPVPKGTLLYQTIEVLE